MVQYTNKLDLRGSPCFPSIETVPNDSTQTSFLRSALREYPPEVLTILTGHSKALALG